MGIPSPTRSAAVDAAAANLSFRLTQGDDFRERFVLRSRHYDELNDRDVRIDIAVKDIVFDATIFQANGTPALAFDVLDVDDFVVELSLHAVDTATLTPGTYTWWLRGSDTNAGTEITYCQGSLEIRQRPQ